MKTLKESILSRSSHGAKGFEAQRRTEMIKEWLKEYDIENYTINRDFTIDVNESINLYNMDNEEFPEYIQFGVVKGDFDCSTNKLTSLRGCPREVEGDFNCGDNELTSLEGAPVECHSFFCYNNNLITLKGAPKETEDFGCDDNKLTDLEGAPKKVGSFNCSYNKLKSLKGAPREVSGNFICNKNPTLFTIGDVRKVCKVKGEITCY